MVSGFNHLKIVITDTAIGSNDEIDVTEQVNPAIIENDKPLLLNVINIAKTGKAVFTVVMSKAYFRELSVGETFYSGHVSADLVVVLGYHESRWLISMITV